MNWFIFALLGVITGAISNLLQKILMKNDKSDPYVYGLAFQFICAFLLTTVALFHSFTVPAVTQLPFNFLLMGISYATSAILMFKALQITELSDATILFSSRALWTICAGLLFLKEQFTSMLFTGTLLIFISIFLAIYQKKRIQFHRGHLYTLGAALSLGIAVANDKFIISTLKPDILSYTAFSFIVPTIFLCLFKPTAIKKLATFIERKIVQQMILLGIFYSFSIYAFATAFGKGATASQIAPISASISTITVFLAVIFLGEKNQLIKKIISAILVIVGVSLLR